MFQNNYFVAVVKPKWTMQEAALEVRQMVLLQEFHKQRMTGYNLQSNCNFRLEAMEHVMRLKTQVNDFFFKTNCDK